MATPANYHTSARPANYELRSVISEASRKGAHLADDVFRELRGLDPPRANGHRNGRRARQWSLQRRAKLAPICEGEARIVGKRVLNLASGCRADFTGRMVLRHLQEIARAGAREYVNLVLEAAITWHGRIDSRGVMTNGRSVRSKRALGILTLGVVLYHLRMKREGEGPSQYGFVVRGLPRETFNHMLAFWDHGAKAASEKPAQNTLWGRNGGTYKNGGVGWMQALVDVGAIRTNQPNQLHVPPWEKGAWKTDPKIGEVRWAFVRIELLIQDGQAPELPLEEQHGVVVIPDSWLAPKVVMVSEKGARFNALVSSQARSPPGQPNPLG